MSLSDFIFGCKILAEINRGNISIKAIGNKKNYSGPADVAIKDGKVMALGDDCKNVHGETKNIKIVNGFRHDRVIVSEFSVAEEFIAAPCPV